MEVVKGVPSHGSGFRAGFFLSLCSWCMYCVVSLFYGCHYQCNQLPRKTCFWNDLLLSSGMLKPTRSLTHCIRTVAQWTRMVWKSVRVFNKSTQSNLGKGPHPRKSKSPLVTMACPKLPPKVSLQVDRSSNPTTCLIAGPVRCQMVYGSDPPFFHNALDRPMDWPTDCPWESLIAIGRCPLRSTRPKMRMCMSISRTNQSCHWY